MSIRYTDAGFVATNVQLTILLNNAYNIRPDLMSGLPGWANSTRFDITAKVSDPDVTALKNLTREQREAMLLALLTDRFKLKAHIETKTLPVYDLVIAKGGSKLKENTALADQSTPGTGPHNMKPGTMVMSDTKLTGFATPTSALASTLAYQVGRNIIDKTGLTGRYDFTLNWSPENRAPVVGGNLADKGSDTDAPDLFTALQEQLGLRLESSKGPVDTLVIDHVEFPTAN